MSRGRLMVVSGVAALLLATSAFTMGAGGAPTPSAVAADQAVEDVFAQAESLHQTVVVPPADYRGGIMTSSVQSLMLTSANTALSRVFTPTMVQKELTAVHNAILLQSTNAPYAIIALGGGVQHIQYESVDVQGNTATVQALVTDWAEVAQVQPGGKLAVAKPQNTLDVTATLALDSTGTWKVSQRTWSFAPGSQP